MRASACRAAIRLVRPHPHPHPRDGAFEIGAFELGFDLALALSPGRLCTASASASASATAFGDGFRRRLSASAFGVGVGDGFRRRRRRCDMELPARLGVLSLSLCIPPCLHMSCLVHTIQVTDTYDPLTHLNHFTGTTVEPCHRVCFVATAPLVCYA